MISIFAALAIVSVFEISLSKAGPITEDAKRATPLKPDEILGQMAELVNGTPEIMCAIADLEPNKIERMTPHLNELTRILDGHPLAELFRYLGNLCAHHEELRQIKRVQRHIDQFVGQNAAGGAPITIKNKTKVKIVYAPHYGSRSNGDDDDGGSAGYAQEVTADKKRIAQEAFDDLAKLKDHAKEVHTQLSEQLMRGNEELKTRLRETQTATKKEMADAIDSMEAEKRKSHEYVTEAVGWLRQQMQRQMEALNAELEEKKKSYRDNVDQLASDIRTSLDKENERVEKQVSEATEHVRRQIADANGQLGAQLERARVETEEAVEKAAKEIEARVRDIREKMRAAVQDLRKDFENVDAELRRSVANAASATNTRSQAEVEKTVAEMKKATRDMRQEMEKEIRSAIHALSAEIKSILADMRNANNTAAETVAVAQPASSVAQTAIKDLAQGATKDLISNDDDNDNDNDTIETNDASDSLPHGVANELHQNDLQEFEDDFEDDEIDENEK